MRPSDSSTTASGGWQLEHSYADLPEALHVSVAPTAVRDPRLAIFNRPLAEMLGLDPEGLSGEAGAAIFAGNQLPPDARPLAQAYAGHQFGHFTALGDGRAVLLGEQVNSKGERYDIQLKGAGRTPFSRNGDGRAALGPMLREYIISEAMHALGIPTTRSLAVATTGEAVLRHRSLPGAVLTRVAASHIRVGTFEWLAARKDEKALRELVRYTLDRHFPDAAEAENPATALLEAVAERQARLIAQWMQVGFVHGVMNTDNMALSGETIDYGPCAFIDVYDPATVFSSIDRHGRYAYGNQPPIAQWNLARLAETLLPLLHAEEEQAVERAEAALEVFTDRFTHHWRTGMRRKLGLLNEEPEDVELIDRLLRWMEQTEADFTNTFRALSDQGMCEETLATDDAFRDWHEQWVRRRERQPFDLSKAIATMRAHNPAVIPRNHKVEEALEAAENGDLSVVERLLDALTAPYDHGRERAAYMQPPAPGEGVYQTFCGT